MSGLIPVNLSRAVRTVARVLDGTTTPPDDASGARGRAVARLAAVLTEDGSVLA